MKTHLPSALFFLALLFFSAIPAAAQEAAISGRILDKESLEGLPKATLQLLRISTNRQRQDTTFVDGVVTDDEGRFAFKSVANGQYLLKASYVGYEDVTRYHPDRYDRKGH